MKTYEELIATIKDNLNKGHMDGTARCNAALALKELTAQIQDLAAHVVNGWETPEKMASDWCIDFGLIGRTLTDSDTIAFGVYLPTGDVAKYACSPAEYRSGKVFAGAMPAPSFKLYDLTINGIPVDSDFCSTFEEMTEYLATTYSLRRMEYPMHIKLWQINTDRDKKSCVFFDYETALSLLHSDRIDPSIYDTVYDGYVDAENLEEVFRLFNDWRGEQIPAYKGRSMSVSDVVEVIENGRSAFYFCDSFGFKKIDFERTK